MSFQLDEATLAAMTQEARACFLDEDAPDYLQALEEGLKHRHGSPDFTVLLRAAHSLKGGAGLAQLPSLGELAHHLEDLLQILQKGQGTDLEEGWALLEWSVLEVANLLNQARTKRTIAADPALLKALAAFVPARVKEETHQTSSGVTPISLIKKALSEDLEVCFVAVEELPPDAAPEIISDRIVTFFDEGLLLGETLGLSWLVDGIEPLETILEVTEPSDTLVIAKQLIEQLRYQRDEYLSEQLEVGAQSETPAHQRTISQTPVQEFKIESPSHPLSPPIPVLQEEKAPLSQLRIPLKRIEGMTHHVEELILTQERLRLQQQHLNRSNQQLRDLSRYFEPIREQIQSLYDQLALSALHISSPAAISITPHSSPLAFDAMELDRYTELHSNLQMFQELILRVQEARSDIDLINRDFSEDLEQVQGHLDGLYENLTQSRLVPFRLLAQRFIPQLQTLNRRYGKSADLIIEGEETLVDQVLLEQLQTPLTHLLNNAFDHGIEPPEERLALGKPETSQISLTASIESNTLVIRLSDDGHGIDLQRVYQCAKERGLCPSKAKIEQYSSEQILDWIFQPGFSTAEKVSALSGRGVGLDIVRTQIQHSRGSVQVQTQPQKGTTFIVKLPLNLSLMSLSLVQLERRLVAFPSTSILESVPYNELKWLTTEPPTVSWREHSLPVIPLSELLPCSRQPLESVNPRVGLVMAGAEPFVIAVNSLLGERQLIVKPLDETVVTPAYLVGCTILGSGEVVPVLLPQALEITAHAHLNLSITAIPSKPTKTPTVLIAEDSVATRRLLERMLTQIGLTTVVCRDGQEALDELYQRHGQVDLVISDVEMPRLNGFELLQQLRSHKDWKKIPVVMATSRTGDRHRQQAMHFGASAYLGKPIQSQEFLATIQTFLGVRS